MEETCKSYQFYEELAVWWPLISPAEDYREEALYAAGLLGSAARPVTQVLELGSGGGHNAFHMKGRFELTLSDRAEGMLAVSRALNPECEHVRGDMRTLRLGRDFDAVFVHDAVCYMTTEADLRAVFETAYAHCRPGGIAVFAPDDTRETFEPATGHGGHDGEDGRGVRYLEWSYDPDPADSWTVVEFAFVLRERDGATRTVHETHRFGLFGRDVWLRLLAEVGFEAEAVTEVTTEERAPRELFIGRRACTPGS